MLVGVGLGEEPIDAWERSGAPMAGMQHHTRCDAVVADGKESGRRGPLADAGGRYRDSLGLGPSTGGGQAAGTTVIV